MTWVGLDSARQYSQQQIKSCLSTVVAASCADPAMQAGCPAEQLPPLKLPADLYSNVQPVVDMLHSSQHTLLQLCPLHAAPAMTRCAKPA